MLRYKPVRQTAGQPQRAKGNRHQPTRCLTELTGSLMLIQTYKRLVSRRGPEQSGMHAYGGPVKVQMTRSRCGARLNGPRVRALNIFSCGGEAIWACLFVCLLVCESASWQVAMSIHTAAWSTAVFGGRVSLESERTYRSARV